MSYDNHYCPVCASNIDVDIKENEIVISCSSAYCFYYIRTKRTDKQSKFKKLIDKIFNI